MDNVLLSNELTTGDSPLSLCIPKMDDPNADTEWYCNIQSNCFRRSEFDVFVGMTFFEHEESCLPRMKKLQKRSRTCMWKLCKRADEKKKV